MASDKRSGSHKDAAIEFLRLCATGKVREAYERFVALGFRHHNVHFPGDRESLIRGMEEASHKFPATKIDVKLALEDGDLVAVYSRVKLDPGGPEVAVVHILRFEGDKVVEMWDVGQAVPADSPNKLGSF